MPCISHDNNVYKTFSLIQCLCHSYLGTWRHVPVRCSWSLCLSSENRCLVVSSLAHTQQCSLSLCTRTLPCSVLFCFSLGFALWDSSWYLNSLTSIFFGGGATQCLILSRFWNNQPLPFFLLAYLLGNALHKDILKAQTQHSFLDTLTLWCLLNE